MNRLKSALAYGIHQSVRLPYAEVTQEKYVINGMKDFLSIWKKFLHRWLLLLIHKQQNLVCDSVPPNSRVLFLFHGVNNFGDAIMDLSGRKLLNQRKNIDLLIAPEISSLFKDDEVFERIYTDISQLSKCQYDFILMNTLGIRSIKFKARHFKKTPFACISGNLMHVDYNRIQLGFFAINSLFKLNLSTSDLLVLTKPYLPRGSQELRVIKSPILLSNSYVVIALGGIDPQRTYGHWAELLQLLDEDIEFSRKNDILFIGSANAQAMEDSLIKRNWQRLRLHSYVNKVNFLENQNLIAESILFIGADGGLMHLAHTTKIPSVTLFNYKVNPSMRLTAACQSTSIRSNGGVSQIDPKHIYNAIVEKTLL